MENRNHSQSPLRPQEQLHRKQFTWQILLPILLAILAVLVLGILAIVTAGAANSDNTRWAMIATIFLLIPWLLFSLVPLVLLILGIWLLRKSHKSVTPYLVATAVYSGRLRTRVEGITQGAASPLIRARAVNTGLLHLLKMAFHLDISPKE